MTDNFEVALQKENAQLRDLVRRGEEDERELRRQLEEARDIVKRMQAERDEARTQAEQAHADWKAELDGNAALRRLYGARPDETFFQFVGRLASSGSIEKAARERAEADCAALLSLLDSMSDFMREDGECRCGGDDCHGHDSTCVLSLVPREKPTGAALLERLRAAERVVEAGRVLCADSEVGLSLDLGPMGDALADYDATVKS